MSKILADFKTQLKAKISVGETAGILVNNIDEDSVTIPNGNYYFTLDGNSSLKEYIYCTVTDKNITSIQSVSVQGVKTTGVRLEHNAGALLSITNYAELKFLNDILSGSPISSSALIYDSAATISDDKHIGTKAYADGVSIATPTTKATTSVLGIVKTATAPTDANNPVSVSDTDPKLPTQGENDAMAGTSGTPSSSNKFVTSTDTGLTGNMLISGVQSIDGIKTFTSIPVLPASNPTTDNQLARKAYVDSLLN